MKVKVVTFSMDGMDALDGLCGVYTENTDDKVAMERAARTTLGREPSEVITWNHLHDSVYEMIVDGQPYETFFSVYVTDVEDE